MARPFRFGVNMRTPDGEDGWQRRCRRAENLGYDVVVVPDHLGMAAPFPSLVAAARATSRIRVGTHVINTAFWNPVLLAREIATTDALTGGRLEVGLGTGHVREEHERAGLEFASPGERVGRLRRCVGEVHRLLTDEEHLPRPSQRPRPPLLIGGNGDRVLRLAAERAEIVSFTGARDTGNGLRALAPEEFGDRIAAYRRFAAGRTAPAELNLLIQHVAVTPDRRSAVRNLLAMAPHLSEEQALELPLLAVGTVGEIADQLRCLRERFGLSYFTVLDPFVEVFAPVIDALRGT